MTQSKDVGYESSLMSLLNRLREMHVEMKEVIAVCEDCPGGSLYERFYSGIRESSYVTMLPPSMLVSGRAAPIDCGSFPKFQKLLELFAAYEYLHPITPRHS